MLKRLNRGKGHEVSLMNAEKTELPRTPFGPASEEEKKVFLNLIKKGKAECGSPKIKEGTDIKTVVI